MLFNSISYFLFLGIVFVVNYILPGKFRWLLLLSASIFFYAVAGASTIAIPVVITIATYACGVLMEKAAGNTGKKAYFWIGICINLGLLVFFKYINFFLKTLLGVYDAVKGMPGTEHTSAVLVNVVIPLGISYVTFQAIGYLIEIKRGNHKAEKNLGLFATYIMFFPKLLSGPIERAHNFLPQLHEEKEFNYEQVVMGSKRILWGLFMKLVVAGRLGLYTDVIFDNFQYHTGTTLLLASIFYPIQLYADLGGYTAMAIGSAQILGYKLMENFDSPFIAKSVSEFWRRWHISLTTWVNEYIYIPIVINRRGWGRWGVVYGVIITFLMLGFWHGASWNFIIFGLLQGIIIALEFLSRKVRKQIRSKIPGWINTIISMGYTFGYFCFSSIFFRANTASDAIAIIRKIGTLKGGLYYYTSSTIIFCLFGVLFLIVEGGVYALFRGRITFFNNKNWVIRKLSYAAVIIIILLIGVFDGGQFIYFKF